MARANNLAARVAGVANAASARNSAPAEVSNSAPAEVRTSAPAHLRTAGVRVTVELQPLEHRDLQALAREAQEVTGVTRVAGAEVLRQLLAVAIADPQLRAVVFERLRASGGTRRG